MPLPLRALRLRPRRRPRPRPGRPLPPAWRPGRGLAAPRAALRPAEPAQPQPQPQRSAPHRHRRGPRSQLSACPLPFASLPFASLPSLRPSLPARPAICLYSHSRGTAGEELPALRRRRRAPTGLPPAKGVRGRGGRRPDPSCPPGLPLRCPLAPSRGGPRSPRAPCGAPRPSPGSVGERPPRRTAVGAALHGAARAGLPKKGRRAVPGSLGKPGR